MFSTAFRFASQPPRFVWAVQGFNLVNLRNTGIDADEARARSVAT